MVVIPCAARGLLIPPLTLYASQAPWVSPDFFKPSSNRNGPMLS